MGAGADETAESLNEQVEYLRSENVKLRELLESMGVELPSVSLEEGGVMGAADTLVHLMSEGGSLLREREDLILEHARLSVAEQASEDQDPDLDRLLDALLEVEALQAEREQLRAERGLPEEVDDFEDALTRLRPLFNEIDGLRAERHVLASERKGLVEAVEAVGMSAEEILCEEDRDLELQLLNAVKGVVRENESLKAEIQELQAQISRLRDHRSSDQREALEELPQVAPAPRPKAPSPAPELHSVNTLVLDRPSKPEALGVFAAGNEGVPKESRSDDLEKLQEIIDRLQTENSHLKSQILALTPQAKSAGELVPEAPPLPENPGAEEPIDAQEAAEPARDMPEASAPEQEAEVTTEESHAKAEQPGDMPEAPPPQQEEATTEDCIDHGGAGNMRPEAPPLPEKDAMMEELQQMKGVKIVGAEEPQKAPKANVRPKQAKRPRPRPEELLKQAGVPLTTEGMLKQLLSPHKSNKVMLPRTELPPEDPDEIAMQQHEALAHLLRIQLGRPRGEGSELDGRSRELSPSPKDLDVDEIQEQAMKRKIHDVFRSFGPK